MNFNEYEQKARRTSKSYSCSLWTIKNGIYGLNGESGELIDLLKKFEFQGHAFDVKKMVEELGDVLWYCAELAHGLGVPLEEVAKRNIAKLEARYPAGFETSRSVNRQEERDGKK